MKCQQKKTDDVKDRHVNVLKSVNHHRVNVVTIERIEFEQWKLRIEFARREMEQVKNNEREHDESAHDHVTRSPARFDVVSIAIRFRTRAAVFNREQNCEINVQNHCDQKKHANHPKNRAEIAKMLRVGVDPFWSEINLQIAEQMSDHEQNQNHACSGDDYFPADGGMGKFRDEAALRCADGRGRG